MESIIKPLSSQDIQCGLKSLGIMEGDLLLVHSSLSSLGWVIGGAQTAVDALLEALGSEGTLVMPTHTSGNTDPKNWSNPPVPKDWWESIRASMPAFDPSKTPSLAMGVIPELFRSYPGVERSSHPVCSFAAHGPLTKELISDLPFQPEFGEGSILDRLREKGAKVLLLGADHGSNTTLHLSEHLADFSKKMIEEGSSMEVLGQRKWVRYKMLALDNDDFEEIGHAFAQAHLDQPDIFNETKIGAAQCEVFLMSSMVEFGRDWMSKNRS